MWLCDTFHVRQLALFSPILSLFIWMCLLYELVSNNSPHWLKPPDVLYDRKAQHVLTHVLRGISIRKHINDWFSGGILYQRYTLRETRGAALAALNVLEINLINCHCTHSRISQTTNTNNTAGLLNIGRLDESFAAWWDVWGRSPLVTACIRILHSSW